MSVLDGLYVGGLVAVGLGIVLGLLGGPIGLLLVRAGVVSVMASVFLPILVAVVLGFVAMTQRTGQSQQTTRNGGGTHHGPRPQRGSGYRQSRQSRGHEQLDLDTDTIEDYRR